MAMLSINDGLYLGVDGCRGGWIACILDHGEMRIERYDSVETLIQVSDRHGGRSSNKCRSAAAGRSCT